MSASAEKAGPESTRYSGWLLSVMDADTAEPIPSRTIEFTRLGRSILAARATILDRFGIPWRIDPIKKEEA